MAHQSSSQNSSAHQNRHIYFKYWDTHTNLTPFYVFILMNVHTYIRKTIPMLTTGFSQIDTIFQKKVPAGEPPSKTGIAKTIIILLLSRLIMKRKNFHTHRGEKSFS